MKPAALPRLAIALAVASAALVSAQSHPVSPTPGAAAKPAPTTTPYKVATFDSGFGGYFTAKEIARQAAALGSDGYGPVAVAHYGDTTNVPYGEKTPEQIAAFSTAGILAAFKDGASDVYVACNTASTQIDRIRELLRGENASYPNHVYSIIDVSVREVMKTVSARLKSGDVATVVVLATPATVKSETYPRFLARALNATFTPGSLEPVNQPRWLAAKGPTIDSYVYRAEIALGPRKKVVVYQFAPANWVDMIEHGAPDAEKREAVARDLAALTGRARAGERFDVVGEFCTHYPVFDAQIRLELAKLGRVASDTPFIVQGPLMGALFRAQFLQRKPVKAATAVAPPATPPIYLSGTNLDAIRELVQKIFPNDPAPDIAHRDFVVRH